MSERKKKSLFDRAIDALTDRDETEAAEDKVAPSKAAAEKAAAQKAALDKPAADKAAAQRADAERAARINPAMPKKGVVTVRSLRIRADHSTRSDVVGGLLEGNEVTILGAWSDGKNTWARLDKGWAAMVYDGETYIELV